MHCSQPEHPQKKFTERAGIAGPFRMSRKGTAMLSKIGRMIEKLGSAIQQLGRGLQTRGYPRVTPIYEHTPRPSRDTPMYPGEF